MIFDKTGTLTTGNLKVEKIWMPDGREFSIPGEAHEKQAVDLLTPAASLCPPLFTSVESGDFRIVHRETRPGELV